jgi:hypothetical protein
MRLQHAVRWCASVHRIPRLGILAFLAASTIAGCTPTPPAPTPAVESEWHAFEGTWTAAGQRQVLSMGPDRRASVSTFSGSLVLRGEARPGVGYRAVAVVFNDTATGMLGRAVWTDERGDEAWSELRGEGTATGNRILGTFVGGTGRYTGITGDYAFTWRFVLENEDGTVQGQSVGLKGRVRGGPPGGGAR